jgi:predicted  nucleic acid-binding Zn-ribbon protein
MANVRATARSSDFGPCLSPASFWKPYYLESSAWIEHSPFAFWITSVLKPRSIVELGTHYGFSYFAFCQAVQTAGLETRCFAVDTWKGDEHAGFYGEDVFEDVNRYNNQHYSTFSRLVRSTFEEALTHFPDSSVDLLHIDGRHFYQDVRYDFESWRPKLSERAVVLFHDTNVRERGFGVFQLWAELANKFPNFEFFHGHGLGVLGHGVELPEEVVSLCESSADSAAALRTAYSRLGRAVQSDLDANITRSRPENSEMVVRGLRTELENRNGEIAKLGNECKVLNDETAVLGRGLESRKSEIANLRTELEARNDQTAALTPKLETRYRKLVGEDASMKDRSEAIEADLVAPRQQHAALETRMTRELALALENLPYCDSEGITLTSDFAIARTSIAAVDSEMEDARSKFAKLEAEMLQSEAERTDLLAQKRSFELQLSARTQDLDNAIKQIEALYTSSSWRLTRPLRALKRGVICLRRKGANLLP